MSNFTERMIRAAKLDASLYEEVEDDKTAMGQAMGVVVLSSLAAGIGSASMGGRNLIVVTIAALVGWYIWAYLTYFIGTKLLAETQTEADHGELLRTIGFSSSPGLIRILGIIPGFTNLVFAVAGIWMLIAMVIAVRQALDYTKHAASVGCVLHRLDHSEHLCRPLIVVCGRVALEKPADTSVYASSATSRCRPQDSTRPEWIRYILFCTALSSPTTCRFIPALSLINHLPGG